MNEQWTGLGLRQTEHIFSLCSYFLEFLGGGGGGGGNIISELRKHICCSLYRFIDMRGLKGTNIQYCIKGNILIDISLFNVRTFYALPSILFLVVGLVLII